MTAELDNLRRYHRQILLELPLGVCAISHEQQVVIWNLAMEVCSTISSENAVGSHLNQLPNPWGEVLAGFARASDNHIHHMEVHFDGRDHWFNLHKAAIVEPESQLPGAAPGLVILVEDLTDMENLEAELAHSDRLASIGRLAAGVAHEIGNPVTGIASLAQNLQFEQDEKVIRQSIKDILSQTKRITHIVQSLMNFSRSSGAGLALEPLQLCLALNDALELVKLTHQHKHLRFATSCEPDIRVMADRQRLSQVFVNLLGNAGDASPEGARVDLLVRQQQDRIIIEIMDQGSGIPQDVQGKLFEPFVTTKPAGKGTGLGLALAHKIILDHHGTIEIDSQQGMGTRVVVSLPAFIQ